MKKTLIAAVLGLSTALAVPASAADPTIPIIVKDTTSFYWQIVLAGARKAGQDLGVNVPELGAQSESDISGQISILENAVAQKPAAVVISPTEFKALGKPIDEAAKNVKIIGIDSSADSKAFTSFLTTDNVQGGRIAADGLAAAIAGKYGKADVAGTYKDGKIDLAFTIDTEEAGTGTLKIVGALDGDAITGNWEFTEYNGTFKATRAAAVPATPAPAPVPAPAPKPVDPN